MRYYVIIIILCLAFLGTLPSAPHACAAENSPFKAFLEAVDDFGKSNPEKNNPSGVKTETEEVQVLKQADVERIGAQAAYEEFTGVRFGKYFTIGQRVEIYQEARPIDSYMLDVIAIRHTYEPQPQPWDTAAHFRSQIVPMFTRAYGTEITMDNPDDPEAKIRYTHDYRDIYKQYYPRFTNIQVERWDQNEILLIHAKRIPGIDWYYTLNLGYRYSTINVKDVPFNNAIPMHAGDENRHTYFASLALKPNEQFEWYGQYEYFKSKRIRSAFPYSPDHWLYRTEFRFKTSDLKTSFIPGFSYSVDRYYPFKDTYEKYEMFCRIGRDFTEKLSATTRIDYVLSMRHEKDARSVVPAWPTPDPHDDAASWVGTKNRVSYNVWDKFYLQGGADFAAGTNMSDFDNWGTFLGIEYYNPGVLRANFGWNVYRYYNIDDFLNTIGFRVYIFM